MAVPTRPAAGAPIESAWGSIVHDQVVALDIQSGVATLVPGSGALTGVLVITFPRPFAAVPLVVATCMDVGTGSVNVNIGVVARTATTVSIGGRDVRETAITYNVPVSWVAIGPRA